MITERDLKLEYLRDTGKQVNTKIEEEVEVEYEIEDSFRVECKDCGFVNKEFISKLGYNIEYVTIDIQIDKEFYNWCIEKLLELKNKENV